MAFLAGPGLFLTEEQGENMMCNLFLHARYPQGELALPFVPTAAAKAPERGVA